MSTSATATPPHHPLRSTVQLIDASPTSDTRTVFKPQPNGGRSPAKRRAWRRGPAWGFHKSHPLRSFDRKPPAGPATFFELKQI